MGSQIENPFEGGLQAYAALAQYNPFEQMSTGMKELYNQSRASDMQKLMLGVNKSNYGAMMPKIASGMIGLSQNDSNAMANMNNQFANERQMDAHNLAMFLENGKSQILVPGRASQFINFGSQETNDESGNKQSYATGKSGSGGSGGGIGGGSIEHYANVNTPDSQAYPTIPYDYDTLDDDGGGSSSSISNTHKSSVKRSFNDMRYVPGTPNTYRYEQSLGDLHPDVREYAINELTKRSLGDIDAYNNYSPIQQLSTPTVAEKETIVPQATQVEQQQKVNSNQPAQVQQIAPSAQTHKEARPKASARAVVSDKRQQPDKTGMSKLLAPPPLTTKPTNGVDKLAIPNEPIQYRKDGTAIETISTIEQKLASGKNLTRDETKKFPLTTTYQRLGISPKEINDYLNYVKDNKTEVNRFKNLATFIKEKSLNVSKGHNFYYAKGATANYSDAMQLVQEIKNPHSIVATAPSLTQTNANINHIHNSNISKEDSLNAQYGANLNVLARQYIKRLYDPRMHPADRLKASEGLKAINTAKSNLSIKNKDTAYKHKQDTAHINSVSKLLVTPLGDKVNKFDPGFFSNNVGEDVMERIHKADGYNDKNGMYNVDIAGDGSIIMRFKDRASSVRDMNALMQSALSDDRSVASYYKNYMDNMREQVLHGKGLNSYQRKSYANLYNFLKRAFYNDTSGIFKLPDLKYNKANDYKLRGK